MDNSRDHPFLDFCKVVADYTFSIFILWLIVKLIGAAIHGFHMVIDLTAFNVTMTLLCNIVVVLIVVAFIIMAMIGAIYWLYGKFEEWNRRG